MTSLNSAAGMLAWKGNEFFDKQKCSESEKAKETTSSNRSVDVNVMWTMVKDAQNKSKENSSSERTQGEESRQQDDFQQCHGHGP